MTVIESPDQLPEIYGPVSAVARDKAIDHLDRHARAFIALSPFLILGSAEAGGPADVSPKGDAPGFVAVLDGKTLAIPDRLGNNRTDSIRNILANPHVALIFLVPGRTECLRVAGRARIETDPALLADLAVHGKTPRSAIVVAVDEVFLHCGKAVIRAKLWHPEAQVGKDALPSLGAMLADQIAGIDPDATEAAIEDGYRKRLY